MSFKIVDFLKSSQAFNLQELVRFSINRAVTVYSTIRYAGGDQNKAPQTSLDDTDRELTEIITFTLESMNVDQECIASSDLSRLVENVCYGVIQQSHLHIHKQKMSCDDQLVQSIYKLFAAVLSIREAAECQPLKSKIQKDCIVGLCNYSEEQRVLVNLSTIDHHEEPSMHQDVIFSIQNSLGVLDHLLNSLKLPENNAEFVSNPWLEECFPSLVEVLEFSEATICSHVSGILLPKLLKSSRSQLQEKLTLIWERLLLMHKSHGDGTTRLTSNVYIALCGLSEFYIPVLSDSVVSSSSWMLSSDEFWRVLQSGLIHSDPLARKQACFLMKRAIGKTSMENKKLESTSSVNDVSETSSDRASRNGITSGDDVPVFWWSSDVQEKLLAMWADFFLLYEALDEVQVHVVMPVMPRLKSLIQSASSNQSGVKAMLHTSWLTILFSRSFVHETKTMLQWGLLQYLHVDINTCPMIQQGGVEFFFNTVLPVLCDDNLYGGQAVTSLGSRPPVAVALRGFINKFVGVLGTCQTEVFLRNFLLAVSHQSWSPISLTFIFETLTSLPVYNAWGAAELQVLREMQFSCISMLSISYRSVVQCLMIESVLKLLDKDNTTLHQLSNLLGIFSRNDCLIRGSHLWNQVCQWFGANRDSQLFGSNGDIIATLWSEVTNLMTFDPSVSTACVDLGDAAESCRVSCLILLSADFHFERMERQPPSPSSFLQTILEPLTHVLSSINSHIYLPINKTDASLQLVCSILHHLKPSRDESGQDFSDEVRKELSILLSPCLEEIFSFIARRLLSAELAQTSDISRVSLYISVLDSVCTFMVRSLGVSGCVAGVIRNGRTRLLDCCLLLLTQGTECRERDAKLSCFQTYVSCSLLLWLLQSSSVTDSLVLPWDKLLPLVTVEADKVTTIKADSETSLGSGDTTTTRKISSLLLCTRWQCISVLLRRDHAGSLSFPGAQPHETILAACLRDLSLVKGPDAVPLLQCAKLLVSKVIDESTPLCLDVIDAAWSSLQDEWRGKAQKFWILYSAVIELIFQHCFLGSADPKTHDAVEKMFSSILTLGEGKPMIISIFIKHLCNQWLNQMRTKPRMTSTLRAVSNHINQLLEVCVMGTRVSKDTRLQQDTSVFLITLDQLQSVRKELSISMEQRPGHRRVILLNFLLTVARTKTSECCQLITDFVQGLVKKFLEMKTTTRRGYAMNSLLHRENVRLWQTLLLLAPYIQKEYASELLDNVLTSAVKEKQSSVRHLMVWVAIRVLLCHPNLQEMVWDQVHQLRDTSESNICPLLILIAHLGVVQPDLKHKESFYKRAFPVLLPRALVQTSSIRHTGQLCVKKLWQDCTRDGLQGAMASFPALLACMEYLHDFNPSVSSHQKMDSNFFLFKVNPCQDYTIQTIFNLLPYLSSIAVDELLEAESFEKECPSLWRNDVDSHPVLPLYNPPESQIQQQYLLARSVKGPSGGISLDQAETGEESDIQKKMIPWQSMSIPGFDDLRSEGHDRSSGGSLVLVASLVNKAPNLGGLCRTSQIFGVSTFVVSSLRATEDKNFKSVSVTAEKWLPMIEVPVSDLAPYLQSMRHQGYTLVGVEQTARSKCLTQYNFPQRTLLLLGMA
ncbi:probable methyltransferase TARBP1 isoform X2 [Asterias amurensis]|uniref:probable methyltransferase TARBP1 isoform X2 n=1 Tax=Asterias amurensis TaxID=7602 RepID=UPI003AB5A3BE